MLDKLTNFFGGGILGGVNKIAKTFFGSKESREVAGHHEHMAFLQGIANDMIPRSNRTWWDSLVDGINRLIRPGFTLGVGYMFWYCINDPVGFSMSVQALSLMPEQGWWIMFAVISFWFGGKFIGKDMKPPRPIDPKAIAEVIKAKKDYEDSKPPKVVQPDGESIFAVIREHVKDLDPEAALNELLGKPKGKTNEEIL